MIKRKRIVETSQNLVNGSIKNSKHAYLHLGHHGGLIFVDNLCIVYLQVIKLFMAAIIFGWIKL
jgi:hypothetical protein